MTTVYFAGGEDIDFTLVGSSGTSQSGGYFRSAFARGALCVSTGFIISTADPPSDRLTSPTFSAISTFWAHAQFYASNSNTTNNNATLMRLLDGGTARIVVRGTGTAGQVRLEKRNAAGTFTTLATSASGAMAASGIHSVDLSVSYGTSGRVILYVDGVSIADSGVVDVTTDSATTLNQLELAALAAPGSGYAWSEAIVQDTSTLGTGLLTLPPMASGATQSWTGSVGNVNEWQINDSANINTASVNALSEWTVATTLPTGTWTIEAIVQSVRVEVGTTGPQNAEFLVRTTDGSDHVAGSFAPTTSLANYRHIWSTNPHTSAAWATGDLINAGIESLT
jgi:hypothetical protein